MNTLGSSSSDSIHSSPSTQGLFNGIATGLGSLIDSKDLKDNIMGLKHALAKQDHVKKIFKSEIKEIGDELSKNIGNVIDQMQNNANKLLHYVQKIYDIQDLELSDFSKEKIYYYTKNFKTETYKMISDFNKDYKGATSLIFQAAGGVVSIISESQYRFEEGKESLKLIENELNLLEKKILIQNAVLENKLSDDLGPDSSFEESLRNYWNLLEGESLKTEGKVSIEYSQGLVLNNPNTWQLIPNSKIFNAVGGQAIIPNPLTLNQSPAPARNNMATTPVDSTIVESLYNQSSPLNLVPPNKEYLLNGNQTEFIDQEPKLQKFEATNQQADYQKKPEEKIYTSKPVKFKSPIPSLDKNISQFHSLPETKVAEVKVELGLQNEYSLPYNNESTISEKLLNTENSTILKTTNESLPNNEGLIEKTICWLKFAYSESFFFPLYKSLNISEKHFPLDLKNKRNFYKALCIILQKTLQTINDINKSDLNILINESPVLPLLKMIILNYSINLLCNLYLFQFITILKETVELSNNYFLIVILYFFIFIDNFNCKSAFKVNYLEAFFSNFNNPQLQRATMPKISKNFVFIKFLEDHVGKTTTKNSNLVNIHNEHTIKIR